MSEATFSRPLTQNHILVDLDKTTPKNTIFPYKKSKDEQTIAVPLSVNETSSSNQSSGLSENMTVTIPFTSSIQDKQLAHLSLHKYLQVKYETNKTPTFNNKNKLRSVSPANNTPSFQKIKQKEFDTVYDLDAHSTEGMPDNPIYLMTRSSCDGIRSLNSNKVRIPLARNPVKDFGITYLAPTMWPSCSQNRLKSQRSSLMPALKTPLLLKKVMSGKNLNQTQSYRDFESKTDASVVADDLTPFISKNRINGVSQIGARKFGLTDFIGKKCAKLSKRADKDYKNMFTKRSNSAMTLEPRTERQRPKSHKFNRKTSHAETNLSNSDCKSMNIKKLKLVKYIKEEIDKLDQIKQNLSSVIVDIQQEDESAGYSNMSNMNSTMQDGIVNRRSPVTKPPLASESFTEIMMQRLLKNDPYNVHKYNQNYSTVHNEISKTLSHNLSKSREGGLGNMMGHHNHTQIKRHYTKLEKILENPRNPNYDMKSAVQTKHSYINTHM
jgi:hypothetical protein